MATPSPPGPAHMNLCHCQPGTPMTQEVSDLPAQRDSRAIHTGDTMESLLLLAHCVDGRDHQVTVCIRVGVDHPLAAVHQGGKNQLLGFSTGQNVLLGFPTGQKIPLGIPNRTKCPIGVPNRIKCPIGIRGSIEFLCIYFCTCSKAVVRQSYLQQILYHQFS